MRGVMPCGSTYVVQSFCATDASPLHRSTDTLWKDVHRRLQLLASMLDGSAEPVVQSEACLMVVPKSWHCSSAMSDSSSNDAGKKAKCQVTVRTFEKWQCELDLEHDMLVRLQCEKNKSDHSLAATL